MKFYGIFNANQNYKLLRYSTQFQNETEYQETDSNTKQTSTVKEVCLPDIDYAEENIGKNYNTATGIFE